MKKPHIFDPKNIGVLEEEARRTWQSPEEILGEVEIKPSFIVADLGCGSGFLTIPLSKKARKIYGIDIQREMLKFLEQKIEKLNIKNITPLLSKMDEIPLENENIDLLVSANTLHEFENKEGMIEEIRRVLKPEGVALVVDFEKKNTSFGPPVSIRVSRRQAIAIFEKKGFIVSKTRELQYHYLLVFSKRSVE